MTGLALAAGWAGDLALGDPRRFHPVAGFGRVALALERLLHPRDRQTQRLARARGALFTALLVGGAAGAAELAARGAERLVGRRGRALVLALVTWGALGGRSLAREGTRIAALLERDDLAGARAALPSLAGRDPSQLDASGISRAVVESLAENTADAVVGALVWGAVAGPGGVAAYRAANTLDAMVGHRSPRYERFGFAAAKLDDAIGWPGARLGALLTVALAPAAGPASSAAGDAPAAAPPPAAARPAAAPPAAAASPAAAPPAAAPHGSSRDALRILRRDGAAHPSPNAGRMEAAFAGALGLQLGGPLRYGERHEDRPTIGDGRAATPADARRAARLSLAVGAGAALVCATARTGAMRVKSWSIYDSKFTRIGTEARA